MKTSLFISAFTFLCVGAFAQTKNGISTKNTSSCAQASANKSHYAYPATTASSTKPNVGQHEQSQRAGISYETSQRNMIVHPMEVKPQYADIPHSGNQEEVVAVPVLNDEDRSAYQVNLNDPIMGALYNCGCVEKMMIPFDLFFSLPVTIREYMFRNSGEYCIGKFEIQTIRFLVYNWEIGNYIR